MFGLFKHNKQSKEFYSFFRNVLGFTPRKTEIYNIAFTHKSMSHEVGHGHRVNNERLEYLGDAVLSSVVADYLYKKYPYQGEGFLTEMRSKIVSRASLNKLSKKIGLSQLIQYNRDSQNLYKSIDGDAFEALVGAIYLEKGYKFTSKIIVNKILAMHLDMEALEQDDWNYKSKLIDWCQKGKMKIRFELVNECIQGHNRKQYESKVFIDDEPYCSAIEFTIKAAEKLAAEKTYKHLLQTGVITDPKQKNNNPPVTPEQ